RRPEAEQGICQRAVPPRRQFAARSLPEGAATSPSPVCLSNPKGFFWVLLGHRGVTFDSTYSFSTLQHQTRILYAFFLSGSTQKRVRSQDRAAANPPPCGAPRNREV